MLSSDIQGKHFEGDILNLMLKYIIYLIKKKKKKREALIGGEQERSYLKRWMLLGNIH